MKTRVVIFFVVLALGLFNSWLFGVDFNRRGDDVGTAVLLSLVAAFLSLFSLGRE